MNVRSLLIKTLEKIQSDFSVPASLDMVEVVRAFIAEDKERFDLEVAAGSVRGYFPEGDMRLLAPVISGVGAEGLESALTLVIAAHLEKDEKSAEDVFTIKCVIDRLLYARPPAMTKTSLLLYLHAKHEEYCMMAGEGRLKQQSMLDCIKYCIESKDHWGDAIVESLKTMIAEVDNVPLPHGMVRTAILASNKYVEVKKYVLTTYLPALMRLRVWQMPPIQSISSIWDGVAHAVKNKISSAEIEPTLRAVLGLPAPQMKEIVAVVEEIKEPLRRLMKTFSKEEYVEVLSGKWLFGVENEGSISGEGQLCLGREKEEIVKNL